MENDLLLTTEEPYSVLFLKIILSYLSPTPFMSKRPAEEADPTESAHPPPTKKARTYEPKVLYTVTKTVFRDDYKARGDWSETTVLGTYLSHHRAVQREQQELLGIVCQELEDRKDEEKYAKYWTQEEDDEEPGLDDDLITGDLDKLVEDVATGEFVMRKFSVDIETTIFDDRASDEESL
jgi:hypothetical protein